MEKEKSYQVVALGGGNAMPKAVLEGLKRYQIKLGVICAVLDSGGSAGKERKYFKTRISFGDLRRAALVLANLPSRYKDFLGHYYQDGFLKGHVPINIYCSTKVGVEDNFQKGIEELLKDLKEDLKISEFHQLFPATLDDSTLWAELENGKIIQGEGNIDVPRHDGNLKIKKVFLVPEAKAYLPALEAIEKANLIVIGPGDLYSSILQILLVKGIPEAIKRSKAKKVYICNLMTKFGETNGFSVLDFTREIEKYLKCPLDYVIYNTEKPSAQRLATYKKKHPELLELVKFSGFGEKKFIGENLLLPSGDISHCPHKLAKILLKLLKL